MERSSDATAKHDMKTTTNEQAARARTTKKLMLFDKFQNCIESESNLSVMDLAALSTNPEVTLIINPSIS
jgi:hypothetical protein